MYERKTRERLRERILDHPRNRGRDEGELHEMFKKLGNLNSNELKRRHIKLNRT